MLVSRSRTCGNEASRIATNSGRQRGKRKTLNSSPLVDLLGRYPVPGGALARVSGFSYETPSHRRQETASAAPPPRNDIVSAASRPRNDTLLQLRCLAMTPIRWRRRVAMTQRRNGRLLRQLRCLAMTQRAETVAPFTRGITSWANRSISSSCGLNCSSSRSSPAASNSRIRSAICSGVPISPLRSPRLDTE
jgi:hypothetical protein